MWRAIGIGMLNDAALSAKLETDIRRAGLSLIRAIVCPGRHITARFTTEEDAEIFAATLRVAGQKPEGVVYHPAIGFRVRAPLAA